MKFLTDAQTSFRFVTHLRALDFDVATVYELKLENEKQDSRLVAAARAFERVFITFDQLKNDSGLQVARELRQRGGHVLRILGGPDQDPMRAVGRFLFWLPDWMPDLERESGYGTINDLKNNWVWWSPDDLIQRRVPQQAIEFRDPHYFEQYLSERAIRKTLPLPPKKQRATSPMLQAHMNIPEADERA